jgi:hypothetical protein
VLDTSTSFGRCAAPAAGDTFGPSGDELHGSDDSNCPNPALFDA